MDQIVHNHQLHTIKNANNDNNIVAQTQFQDAMRVATQSGASDAQTSLSATGKSVALDTVGMTSPLHRFSSSTQDLLRHTFWHATGKSAHEIESASSAAGKVNSVNGLQGDRVARKDAHLAVPAGTIHDMHVSKLEPLPTEEESWTTDSVLLRGQRVSFSEIKKEMLTQSEQEAYDASLLFAQAFIRMMLDVVLDKNKEIEGLCGSSDEAMSSRSIAKLALPCTPGSVLSDVASTQMTQSIAPLFFQTMLEAVCSKSSSDARMSQA